MECITERIVNLSDFEKKLSDADLKLKQLIKLALDSNLDEVKELALLINKDLNDLSNFEFVIEHRKVSRYLD